ncbi:MAG: N-acetylmuramoyl-L-alanine amidase [Pseudoalteromonas tetraodonis]|jgi:N-acetylmuramoyl-L-alanine amidase
MKIGKPQNMLRVVIAATFLGTCGASAEPNRPNPAWEVVKHKGESYVTASSLQKFYRFESYSTKEGNLFYRSEGIVMKARNGSQDLLINNTKFILSKPIVRGEGEYLISQFDLTHMVDPVLRPNLIKQAKPFHVVVIDAGHGGRDSGSGGGEFGDEKTHTLKLAILLKAELERRDFQVKMTRTDDQELSQAERVALGNKTVDSIFISLHFNTGGRTARGVETYAPLAKEDAKAEQNAHNSALACAVHASIQQKMKVIDRGIRRAPWAVLTGIKQPAILLEAGYLSNPVEAKKIASQIYQKELATSIAAGIVTYRNALRK